MINIGAFLDKILGKKYKKNEEKEPKEPIISKNNEIVSLTFSLTSDGKLFIDGQWANNTPEMAIILAEFICMLFDGKIYNNFYSYLQVISNINNEYAVFAQNVYQMIQEKNKIEKEINEEPLIRPSQAFNFVPKEQKQNQTISEDDIIDDEDDDYNEINENK